MEPKISKAQLEVWEWKEKAYEEVKHLSLSDALKFIHERTQPIIEEINRKKQEAKEKASSENDADQVATL